MKSKKLLIPLLIILAFLLIAPTFVFAAVGAPCSTDADCTGVQGSVCLDMGPKTGKRCTGGTTQTSDKTACCLGIISGKETVYFLQKQKCSEIKGCADKTAPCQPVKPDFDCALFNTVSTPSKPADTPFEPVVPKLQINIPTVQFSNITKDGQLLGIPFLAEYIAGVYKYAVSIVSIIAVIMIMVGGLRWLTAGGNSAAITSAKETISGAVIGLILLLGSYLVLYTVNPDLVAFKALKIESIKKELVDNLDKGLAAEQGDTLEDGSAAPAPSFQECPLTLDALATRIKNNQRSVEFRNKINTAITGATIGEKIIQIAEAAQKCETSFGSCGATAEAIYQMAGKSIYNKKTKDISQTQRDYLKTAKCQLAGASCNKANARSQVFQKLKSEIGGGWPDSWANTLKPGDVIIVFNANSSDTYGTHSAIFMGWAGDGNAKVVQGGTNSGLTSSGTMCIKSGCSNQKPLIRIRPY